MGAQGFTCGRGAETGRKQVQLGMQLPDLPLASDLSLPASQMQQLENSATKLHAEMLMAMSCTAAEASWLRPSVQGT